MLATRRQRKLNIYRTPRQSAPVGRVPRSRSVHERPFAQYVFVGCTSRACAALASLPSVPVLCAFRPCTKLDLSYRSWSPDVVCASKVLGRSLYPHCGEPRVEGTSEHFSLGSEGPGVQAEPRQCLERADHVCVCVCQRSGCRPWSSGHDGSLYSRWIGARSPVEDSEAQPLTGGVPGSRTLSARREPGGDAEQRSAGAAVQAATLAAAVRSGDDAGASIFVPCYL